jgi:hypothetical protein
MEKDKSRISLLIGLIAVVIIAWGASTAIIMFSLDSWSDRGTFGDLFGSINALFSGLAFAGLLYTIILQKQDLNLQKKEIALNRTELKKSAKAQQGQVEEMKISSKLKALNTIINYYNLRISNSENSEELILKFKEKRKETIKEIEQLIDRVSDDEFD